MPCKGTKYIYLAVLLILAVGPVATAQTADSVNIAAQDTTKQVQEENKSFLQKLLPFLFKGNKKGKKGSKEKPSNPYADYTQEELNRVFFEAAQQGDLVLVEETLKEGALINTTNMHGRTALIEAVRSDRFVVAKKLLDFGASVNVRDRYDATALTYAARTGNSRMYQLLVKYGAKE